MKKIPSLIQRWQIPPLFKNLFVVACMLTSISAYAQQQNASTNLTGLGIKSDLNSASTPDLFIEKNPESPLVKYYLADQTNSRALTAIEYSVMLNNGTPVKHEQKMRNFISDVTTDALKFEKYTAQGVDAKNASKRVSAQPTITPVTEQKEDSKPQPITKTKVQPSEKEYSQTRMQVAPVGPKSDKK